MTKKEAEMQMDKLIRSYCFAHKIYFRTIDDFLFTHGNLNKLLAILWQVEEEDLVDAG